MNAPLSRYLVEFSRDKMVVPMTTVVMPADIEDPEPAPPEPVVTMSPDAFEQKLAQARSEAAAAERIVVEAELLPRFDAERLELLGGFEAAREVWANQLGQRISDSLPAAVAELELRLSSALAQALQPIFAETIRARMLDELAAALAAILSDPSHPPVRIEGPADLLTAFGTAHASGIAIDYVVAEDRAELSIVTATTRVETRLAACLAPFRTAPPTGRPDEAADTSDA